MTRLQRSIVDRSRACGCLLALLLAAGLAPSAPARAADLRRVESVGAVALEPAGVRRQPPRDAAVRAAVARGVESVARGILGEGWEAKAGGEPAAIDPGAVRAGAAPEELDPLLAQALGTDALEYATRYRVVEDRGARKALFIQDPGVETEYVVVVEAYVDAGRVREALRGAGWIDAPAGSERGGHVRLVIEGDGSFAAYDALRRTLLEDLRVRSAIPIELSRGRTVLEVDGPYGAASLQQALIEEADPRLQLVPLQRDGETLTLLVEWKAPPAAPAEPGAESPTSRPD